MAKVRTEIPIDLVSSVWMRAVPERRAEPVTTGIPLPSGLASDPASFLLQAPDGHERPLQTTVLDRWPDGSIHWLLVDFQADSSPVTSNTWLLVADPGRTAATHDVLATEHGAGIRVSTGRATFLVRPGSPFPCAVVEVADGPACAPAGSGLQMSDERGATWPARLLRVAIESNGPLRAVVRCDGEFGGEHNPLLKFVGRLHFFAGSATVRVAVTTLNHRRARHPGNHWELGDAGSVLFRDLSLVLAMRVEGDWQVACSPEIDQPSRAVEAPVEIDQDSSGGENWRSHNHLNRHRRVPMTFRGYRARFGQQAQAGLRATPIVDIRCAHGSLAVAVPRFWQNFPKTLNAAAGRVTVGLWPRRPHDDLHEIQGGEQKTHELVVAFADDRVSAPRLDWCRTPLLARARPSWYCRTAVRHLVSVEEDPNDEHRGLIDAAIEGRDTFEQKREVVDEYGWRHFGETYGDHEAVREGGREPLTSHYNDQYDNIGGFALQFLRSGDPRWWALMRELAAHVADIDIYHAADDKAAYAGGLFWHTRHYVDAGTSTHRSWPRADGKMSGGPGNEHNYNAGLMLHYFLTGDPVSRDAAIGLGEWVLHMDDGARTVFRWLARGDTGLATASMSPAYHGPGRGAGNSLTALVNAHRLTGRAEFLAKAEQVIRRTVHPHDDITARQLGDVERRWSYTVYLQALGRYLDHKCERAELDAMYAYARASLLHYARWMAGREYPTLEKPDILEYPTETWAAQDIRKSDVFVFAALHANGEERARFLERAEFFFRASVSTLARMPTRTLARPVVVLLSNGLMCKSLRRAPDASAPRPETPDADFGEPELFEPQKARALRRARWLAVVGGAAAAGGLMYLLLA